MIQHIFLPHRRNAQKLFVNRCKNNLSRVFFSSVSDTKLLEEIRQANQKHAGRIRVKASNKEGVGYGVFALKDFQKNDIVFQARILKDSSVPTSHSIQVDWNRHADIDLPGRFLNHLCQANIAVKHNTEEDVAYDFVAIKSIASGQELFFDYETSEYELSSPFDCACHDACQHRRVIRGFKHSQDHILETYRHEHIAPYLLNAQKKS